MWALSALPSCLSWIRFALCHGLGSSCRTDALRSCLLDLLHKGLCSTLTGGRWPVERKKNHVFVFFLTVYRFLWHTDCSWMCKRTGLEVSVQPASPYHSDTNADAPGLEVSPQLRDAHAMACGKFSPFITCFLIPFSRDFLLLSKLWTRWVSLAAYFVRISLGDSLRSAVLTHVRSHSRSSVTSCHVTRHLPVMACRKLSPEWHSVGCLLSLSSPMSWMLLGRE